MHENMQKRNIICSITQFQKNFLQSSFPWIVNGKGQRQETSSVYVFEWGGAARIRIILENPEYTIIVMWPL